MRHRPDRIPVPDDIDTLAAHDTAGHEHEPGRVPANTLTRRGSDARLDRSARALRPASRERAIPTRLALVALAAASATAGCGQPPAANAPTTPSSPQAPAASEPPATPGQATPSRSEPTLGAAGAPVTITEFAEFYCPFCALYRWETYPLIERDYIRTGLVKYVFRNLVVHGSAALLASAAGECAQSQGRFWTFHDHMFEQIFPGQNLEQPQEYDLDQLEAMAGPLGLDAPAYSRCLQDMGGTIARCQLEQDRCVAAGTAEPSCAESRNHCMMTNPTLQSIVDDRGALDRLLEALPADEQPLVERIGTPTFFVNGHVLVGAAPYEEFKALIERELARAQRP